MERNYLYDNTKFLMIFMVVFGHSIESFIDHSVLFKVIYMNIYSYHMPVFVIISGIFSKPFLSSESLKKTIKTTLLPFLIFTFLFEIFNLILDGDISYQSKNLYPYPILWFLYSLFIWKLLLPIILNFRFPILLSICIAVAAGYFESIGDFFGISRTLYYFPFYIIGFKLVPTLFSKPIILNTSKIIWFFILIANVIFFIIFNDMSAKWLFGSWSYPKLGHFDWTAGLIRLLLFCISLVTAISILFIVSKEKNWFTCYGEKTLYVYLWHGLLIKVLLFSIGFFNLSSILPYPILLVFLLMFSFVFVMFLSSNFISKYTQEIILKPIEKYLLR